MSRGAWLDIMGLYAYDHTIFNNFVVPTTITYVTNNPDGTSTTHTETIPYTKDNIIDNICMECAELEVLYPDAYYMKLAIGVWSAKRLYTWQRIADVLYRKYDPFINIQRNEWRTVKEDRLLYDSELRDLTLGESRLLYDSELRDLKGTNDVTGKNNVNAYDDSSATGVQRGQVITDQDTTDTGSINTSHSGTVTTTDSGSVNKSNSGNITTTDNLHIEGDSAIRDRQDIIRLETQERLANDLIDIIIEDFKKRFCLQVY